MLTRLREQTVSRYDFEYTFMFKDFATHRQEFAFFDQLNQQINRCIYADDFH